MLDRIYFDHAATAPLRDSARTAMMPYLLEEYGNASSIHGTGRAARKAVEGARRQVAGILGAKPEEVYFTCGGTESDNWALVGYMLSHQAQGRHLVTSEIEHHAVLHTCDFLRRLGFEITCLRPDSSGRISPDDLKKAMREDTTLVSIMWANNEVGTLEPVEELAEMAHAGGAAFHTDAVQAVGAVPVDFSAVQADLLSLSGHKFGGPKGTGAMLVKAGTRLEPLMHGGEQERKHRAGTENVAGIVGMAAALEDAAKHMEEEKRHVENLRNRLMGGLLERIPGTLLNGDRERRLPGNCNVSFLGLEGEAVLLRLDLEGIAASSGSACTAGSLDPSHVLTAIGRTREEALASLRMTLGRENTEEEVDEVLRVLPLIVEDLRRMRR